MDKSKREALLKQYTRHHNPDGSVKPLKVLSSDLLIADVNIPPQFAASDEIKDLIRDYDLDPDHKSKTTLKTPDQFTDFKTALDVENRIKTGEYQVLPGGSCANTLVQMSHVLGGMLDATFMGVAGQPDLSDPNNPDRLIRDGLKDARIKLHEISSDATPSESALSFIINLPEQAGRVVGTWAGTAKNVVKDLLQPGKNELRDTIEKMVKENDVVFVGAGLAGKFGETTPPDPKENRVFVDDDKLGFLDFMLKKRKEQGKDLWLAMPTQADFSTETDRLDAKGKPVKRSHEDKVNHTLWLVRQANVVLCNGEELARVFTDKDERSKITEVIAAAEEKVKGELESSGVTGKELDKQTAIRLKEVIKQGQIRSYIQGAVELSDEQYQSFDFLNRSIKADIALLRLQAEFAKDSLTHDEEWKDRKDVNKTQVGFVTLGKEGIAVVQKSGKIEKYDALPDPKTSDGVLHKIGCGDAAYAGVLSALSVQRIKPDSGISYENAAKAGNQLANIKLQCTGARAGKDKLTNAGDSLGLVQETIAPYDTSTWKSHGHYF